MCDKDHYIALEHRVDELEKRVNTMHDEMRGGFNAVNANIENLSQQITNMDKRIIEEKQKWGEGWKKILCDHSARPSKGQVPRNTYSEEGDYIVEKLVWVDREDKKA